MPSPKKTDKATPTKETVAELREKGALVHYTKSITKNLGHYESTRVEVGVTLPICPTEAELAAVKATIEIADTVLMEELETQIKELAAN